MTVVRIIGNGTGSFTPKSSATAQVDVWGSGAASGGDGSGGGSAGWARKNSFSLTANTPVAFSLGAPGLALDANGADTWWSAAGTLIAAGGGSATTQIGDSTNAGAARNTSVNQGDTGGAGAAGPHGVGNFAGDCNVGSASSGGGGNGGGASSAANTNAFGTAGGNGFAGTGGAGGTPGQPGGNGAGGGGGDYNGVTGFAGGAGGDDYDNGGGGGGGSGFEGGAGGLGGTPGGGGGGGSDGSGAAIVRQGGWSLIRISYTGTDPDQIIYGGGIPLSSVIPNIPASWNGVYTFGQYPGGFISITQGAPLVLPSVYGGRPATRGRPGQIGGKPIRLPPLRDYTFTPASSLVVPAFTIPHVNNAPQKPPYLPSSLGRLRGPRPLVPNPYEGDFSSITAAVAPDAGSVVFTGLAPSVDQSLLPDVGSIVFTGNAPTYNPEGVARRLPRQLGVGPRALIPHPLREFSIPTTVFPGSGSVIFTGFAPSVDESLLPGVGSAVFTGNAPSADEVVLPSVGSVVVTGTAPSLLVEGVAPRLPRQLGRGPRPLIPQPWRRDFGDINLAPTAGSIVFSGLAPSADESVAPGAGSIVFTGKAPSADETVAPGAGSILFTGQAPSADEAVLPGAGSVLFTGQAPSVDEALQPGVGSIVFTGNAPTALPDGIAPRLPRQLGRGPRPLIAHPLRDFSPSAATTLFPDPGSVTFIGQAPSVDEALLPGAGSIVLTGQAPSADLFLPVGVGSIVFSGLAPTPVYNVVAAPDVGSILFTGRIPTVTASAPRVLVAQPQFLW